MAIPRQIQYGYFLLKNEFYSPEGGIGCTGTSSDVLTLADDSLQPDLADCFCFFTSTCPKQFSHSSDSDSELSSNFCLGFL